METELEEVIDCVPSGVLPSLCSGECITEQNSKKGRKITPGIGSTKNHNSEVKNKNFTEIHPKNREAIIYSFILETNSRTL